jgi:predicted ATPase
MLTKWSVENFKSIRDEANLDLAPLTIFAGANSSGKSSFIQSILLIAQSLSNKDGSRPVVLNGPLTSLGKFDELMSNGSNINHIYIKFSINQLLEQNIDSQLHINTDCSNFLPIKMKIKDVNCEISFDAGRSCPECDTLQIQPRLYSSRLHYNYDIGNNFIKNSYVSTKFDDLNYKKCVAKYANNSFLSDNKLQKALNYTVEFCQTQLNNIKRYFYTSGDIKGCEFNHFLPSKIVSIIDTYKEVANYILDIILNNERYFNTEFANIVSVKSYIIKFLCRELKCKIDFDELLADANLMHPSSKDFQLSRDVQTGAESDPITLKIADLVRKIFSSKSERSKQPYISDQDRELLLSKIIDTIKMSPISGLNSTTFVYDDISSINRQAYLASLSVEDFFTNRVKYLNALNYYPKPTYKLSATGYQNDIGYNRSDTANILELNKNTVINYIPSDNFKKTTIDTKLIDSSLEKAVIDWLKYCEIASSLKSRDKGKLGHELSVGIDGSDCLHDLGQVGAGVSQVLPILVMCLIAEPDSTLIFEQPELHLHPTVQFRLADFLLSIALTNKQCIIETHSEYIISRLRYRIALAPICNDLCSQIKIYFVEKHKHGSHFREIVVNQFGAVVDWPDGFFDETPRQASDILMASMMKQRALRGK